MIILGISAFYHDSAAAIICDGKILAAVQEERFSRIKFDSSFPIESIAYCLETAKIELQDLDGIIFYEKPFIKFERLLETYLHFCPRGFKAFATFVPLWAKDKFFIKNIIRLKLTTRFGQEVPALFFSEHHLSHAASAFFPSPFERALVLCLDGVGEWDTCTVWLGEGNKLKKIKEMHYPHSLGLLYSTITAYCGFKPNSGEYKLMGLAPYGQPRYIELIRNHLIDIKEDGSFQLNLKYFEFPWGLKMFGHQLEKLLGFSPCEEGKLQQTHKDLAASIQLITEEIVKKMVSTFSIQFNTEAICLAGGVALNCVANGKLESELGLKKIWIQPAAGDSGASIGAALALNYMHFKHERSVVSEKDGMQGSFLGPENKREDVLDFFLKISASFEELSQSEMISRTARDLAQGQIIGWVQGRMEFGPRALGGRSILADSRSKNMQKVLNHKIKYRESFRPFAPAILSEDALRICSSDLKSPYMLLCSEIKSSYQGHYPAITHVDHSARWQSIEQETNPLFHALLREFKKTTDCPLLINTSFNVRGEPIAQSVEDAYRCFMRTDMDCLVVGNFYLKKINQRPLVKFEDFRVVEWGND